MSPTYDFAGQVALVTGAAMGMGLATARALAQSGASVVLADIDGALAAGEAKRIVAEGGRAIGVACDVAVNQRGVWACMKHELRVMRSQGSGAIVNCSSLGGLVGLPGCASYHGTKHAVLGMTKSAAVEYGG